MEKAYFAHPIDLHLATQTIQGWPKIHLEVWHHDDYNRQEIYGYGKFNSNKTNLLLAVASKEVNI